MLIQKHKKCDICFNDIDRGVECYTIKGKTLYEASGGSIIERSKIDVCGKCMAQFSDWITKSLGENK